MKSMQKGFTLIELMIVVAIIGILAAIAIPQYAEYTNRARVSEGLQLAAAAKTGVSEYYSSQKAYASSNDMAGISAKDNIQGNNVSQVEVIAGGNIQITYKGLDPAVCGAAAGMIELVPDAVTKPGSVQWSKGAATTIGPKCLPANLR